MGQQDSRQEIAVLTGLRGLAILLVLWCHWDYLLVQINWLHEPVLLHLVARFGFIGVYLFFILSGFLLFLPYARALLVGQAWPSARHFYERRLRRIFPLYLIVLVVLLLDALRLGLLPGALGTFAWAVPLVFDWRTDAFNQLGLLNPPLWTLAVEWQFYLLLPWIALALRRLAARGGERDKAARLGLGLGMLVLVGLFLRFLATVYFHMGGAGIALGAPDLIRLVVSVCFGMRGKELELFALGMGGSLFYIWAVEQGQLALRAQRLVSALAGPLSLLGLIGCFWWAVADQRIPIAAEAFPANTPLWNVLGEWVTSLCFLLLLLAVLLGATWISQVFSWPPLCFVGRISYSLYLWHWLLLGLVIYGVVPALLGLFLLCWASYTIIERPFLRQRRAAVQVSPGLESA
jgi:peptidoglycan/LPS O-acetylase OafA/YrhL